METRKAIALLMNDRKPWLLKWILKTYAFQVLAVKCRGAKFIDLVHQEGVDMLTPRRELFNVWLKCNSFDWLNGVSKADWKQLEYLLCLDNGWANTMYDKYSESNLTDYRRHNYY